MARALVLTVIGEDRPGLVEALADLVASHDGSWDESRMARLAGHFAGVVQIHLPDARADGLIEALPGLAERGLSASVVDSDWSLASVDHRRSIRLELVGQDRPGIVREISSALAALGVSVQDLRTVVESAPMSGEPLFRALAELAPPQGVDLDRIRDALERLADELMVDVSLEAFD
ncbi:MAG: ACT domain-containing protein [Myxococcota bacterium]